MVAGRYLSRPSISRSTGENGSARLRPIGYLALTSGSLLRDHPPNPEILNDEDQALIQDVHTLFDSLLLQGIPHYQKGLFLAGANSNNRPDVHTVASLIEHRWHPKVWATVVDEDQLRNAGELAPAISHVFANSDNYRLRRGYNAWHRAVLEREPGERLHQFVRAIEAILRPGKGNSSSGFSYYCQVFTGKSCQFDKLLRELYKLRSALEHMNPYESVLAAHASEERGILALRRTFQAELLASYVYSQIFRDSQLRAEFSTDENITRFWGKALQQPIKFWGNPIDIERLAQTLFDAQIGTRET